MTDNVYLILSFTRTKQIFKFFNFKRKWRSNDSWTKEEVTKIRQLNKLNYRGWKSRKKITKAASEKCRILEPENDLLIFLAFNTLVNHYVFIYRDNKCISKKSLKKCYGMSYSETCNHFIIMHGFFVECMHLNHVISIDRSLKLRKEF